MLYFKKEIMTNPFNLKNGSPVQFHRVKGQVGVIAVEDKKVSDVLLEASRRKMGGIVEIDEDTYREFVGAEFCASGALNGASNNGANGSTWNGHHSAEPGIVNPPTFYHSGDLGDIVYAMATVKELGGGIVQLGPDNRSGMPTREPMTPSRCGLIAPLLAAQPYITRVEFRESIGSNVDYDLNQFRKEFVRCGQNSKVNLAQMVLQHFGLPISLDENPWLTADPLVLPGKCVVMARSQRYHNPQLNWQEIVLRYGSQAVFVGTETEWMDFCHAFGQVDYHKCSNLLEVARIIAGAKLFIGNQSCPYAIAEGLKQNTILETSINPWANNCNFKRQTDSAIKIDSGNPTPQQFTVPSILKQTQWKCGFFNLPKEGHVCYFHAGLEYWNGALHLFARRCRYIPHPQCGFRDSSSDLAIFRLRHDLSVETLIVPQVPLRHPNEQWEDPRPIVVEGKCYVSLVNWIKRLPFCVRQSLVVLSDDLSRFKVFSEPHFGGNHSDIRRITRQEKNWVWFYRDGKLHCVYALQPLTIFTLSNNPVACPTSYPSSLPWKYGEIRGGSNPELVDGEYMVFFHSSATWKRADGTLVRDANSRRYYMGAVTFSSTPPFRLTSITTEPLLIGNESDPMTLKRLPTVFPCGAKLINGEWLVTFGVNDENCAWIKIPHSDLKLRMTAI